MPYDEGLAERVRDQLGSAPGVTEKRMFGGLAFLLEGNLTIGVRRDTLLVRLDPDDTEAALAQAGVEPFVSAGRELRGWVVVGDAAALDEDEFDDWLAQARSWVATLPPK